MTNKKSLLISLAVIFIICFTASIILSILFAENEKPTLNSFGGITENSNSTVLDQYNQCPDCTLKFFEITLDCLICDSGNITFSTHDTTYIFGIGTTSKRECTICGKKAHGVNPTISGPCQVKCDRCNGEGILYEGTIQIGVKSINCSRCLGVGKLECQDCNGNGHLKHDMEWFFFVEKCKDCGGVNPINGNMHSQICNSNDCSNCNGTGFVDCEHCDNGWQYEVCTTCGGDHILD